MTLRLPIRHGRLALTLVAAAALTTACGGGTGSSAGASSGGEGTATTVDVTLNEFEIAFSTTDIPAGEVTFNVTNDGTIEHEFVVFRTDDAADDLPKASGADEVNEDDATLRSMGEVEDVAPGETKSFTATLDAGSYVAICNVEGHYSAGMELAFDAG